MTSAAHIVEELKRQVASGKLRPGARAPSTRALSRRFRVAHATAAKALAELCRQGVLVARPRVGHVVATPIDDEGLSQSKIVRAAMAIADAQGVDGLSMRGVAAALQAPPMSLYRHVRSKDELVEAMVDAAFAEIASPPPVRTWREGLEVFARTLWALFRRHPWLAHTVMVTRPMALPNVIAYADWIFGILETSGADAKTRLELHVTVYAWVRGVAVDLESERRAEAESGLDEAQWHAAQESRFAELARSPDYPSFARLLSEFEDGYDLSLEALFEDGLSALLDGIEKKLALAPAPKRARRRR